MYLFYQITHEKKMINGTLPGTPANKFVQSIVKLSELKTAQVLKSIGVKYALVHRDYYERTELVEMIEELNRIAKNPGLRFVKRYPSQDCRRHDIMCTEKSGAIDLYEVIAEAKGGILR